MKTAIGILALIVVALWLVMGSEKLSSHVRAGGERLDEAIDKGVSDEQLAAQIDVILEDYKKKAVDWTLTQTRLVHRLEKEVGARDALAKQLDDERSYLSRIQQLLSTTQETYRIAAKDYTRAQVEEDAINRVVVAQRLEDNLARQNQHVANLQQAAKRGEDGLASLQQAIADKSIEIKDLKTRLQHARTESAIKELTEQVIPQMLSEKSVFAEAEQNYQDRIADLEARNSMSGDNPERRGLIIDWDNQPAKPAADVVSDYLNGATGSATP